MLVESPNIIIRPNKPTDPAWMIRNYWSQQPRLKLKPLRSMTNLCLSTVTMGLGDTMMLTDLPKACAEQGKSVAVFSSSPHFRPLMKFNPFWKENIDTAYMVNAPDLVRKYDCGNGHYIQRIRRAFGLKVDDIPKGFLTQKPEKVPNRVILHFEAGVHARWQRAYIHPKARMLYEENVKELEKFILQNSHWKFVQVGNNQIPIKGAYSVECKSTEQLVNYVATADKFIGIVSGVMHVATALGLQCVIALNFPEPEKIMLPTLVANGQLESEWLPPMHTFLHLDGEGGLISQFSCYNLFRAFNNELYPFGQPEKYASLIHEKI